MTDKEVVIIEKNQKDQAAALEAFASMINTFIDKSGGIIKELIRTAQSNPAVGILLCYLLTDVFNDMNINGKPILHNDSALALKIILASGAGITLGAEIATVVGDFIPFTSNKTIPNIFQPSAQVLVNSDSPASQAVLKELITKK